MILKNTMKLRPMGKLLFRSDQGYILLDILMGLFIFSVGLTVFFSLVQTAALANSQAHNLLDAINLAGSSMEEIAHNLQQNPADISNYLTDQAGMFHRTVGTKWDSPDMVWVTVEITWLELGESRKYSVESLLQIQG